MKRTLLLITLLLGALALSGRLQPVAAGAQAGGSPIDLSPWIPAAPPLTHTTSGTQVALGYNIVRMSQYCPGTPKGQTCTYFNPRAVYAFLQMDNTATRSGRIGAPTYVQLQCQNFATNNGLTTVQVGVGVLQDAFEHVTPGSIAGILSPDQPGPWGSTTPGTWAMDRHSVSFASVHGDYNLVYLSTTYDIWGGEIRDNVTGLPSGGGLEAAVHGTMLNFAYQSGHFVFTGYSSGQVLCNTGKVPYAGYAAGYNQVF